MFLVLDIVLVFLIFYGNVLCPVRGRRFVFSDGDLACQIANFDYVDPVGRQLKLRSSGWQRIAVDESAEDREDLDLYLMARVDVVSSLAALISSSESRTTGFASARSVLTCSQPLGAAYDGTAMPSIAASNMTPIYVFNLFIIFFLIVKLQKSFHLNTLFDKKFPARITCGEFI